MYLSKLTCSDDDYRTAHRDTKEKVKTTLYYPVQGDSTLETEHHWRYNSNALAGAKRRLVKNMAIEYHSEYIGGPYVSIHSSVRENEIFGRYRP